MNHEPFRSTPDTPNPAPQPRQMLVRLPTSRPILTYLLLGINVLIFAYYFTLPDLRQTQFLYDWGKINSLIRDGEYYRLFTAMFLHLDLAHIFFNGWALLSLGRDVEGLYGTPRFALIYLLGGLTASLASFVFTNALSVGASGAIFAIFGADMVYFYLHRDLHGQAGRQHLSQLVFLMVLIMAQGFISAAGIGEFGIDNAGHVGGLVGGIVLAWFISPAFKIEPDPSVASGLVVVDENPVERWALIAGVYGVALLMITAFAIAA